MKNILIQVGILQSAILQKELSQVRFFLYVENN